MFFLNGKYTSTIVVNGVNKLISKIGDNRVFYSLTGQLEQIGVDRVVYDHERGCIAKVGELDALYDVETRRMSSIGTLPLNYDEQTGCIVSIGNSTVFYANAPEQYEPVEGSYYSPVKADAEAKVKAHGHRVTLNNRYAPQTLSSAIPEPCKAPNIGEAG